MSTDGDDRAEGDVAVDPDAEPEYGAVFWDVGGVIMNIPSITRAQEAFLEATIDEHDLETSLEAAAGTWREALREHFTAREGDEYRTAREGRRKAVEALFDGDPPTDWRDRFDSVRSEHVEPNPGVVETIRALDAAGVYQAVVSDADADSIPDTLERFGIEDCIADVTTSEEVGYVKPDPRMFETAKRKARAAGVDPERGLMVGDKYENDMEGGREAGLTTVAHGAEDGPAVDYRIDDIPELLGIVGLERR